MAKASKSPRTVLVLTCEHGGNDIPPEYRPLFRGAQNVLESHRGWALELANHLTESLHAKLFYSTTSRLLIEPNRSRHHRDLFSRYTRNLPPEEKRQLIDTYYLPHRAAVERHIRAAIATGSRVLHIGVHTFTPELNGQIRTADIGLLYDPARRWERAFCNTWRESINNLDSSLRLRRNYPYLGTSDGFTTHLRTQFPPTRYAGIELEVNQRLAANTRLSQILTDSLHITLRQQ